MSSLFENIDCITKDELYAEGFVMSYEWGFPKEWGIGTMHYNKLLKVTRKDGIEEIVVVTYFPETFEGRTNLLKERTPNEFPDYERQPKQKLYIYGTAAYSNLPEVCFNTTVSNMVILRLLIDKYKKMI